MIEHKRFLPALCALAFLIAGAGSAVAQNLDKFVVKGEAAKKVLSRTEISAETAEKIAKVCEDYASKKNLAVSIFILSPLGTVVHAHRMDGQGPVNVDTALMKAQTALYLRDSTHAWANRMQQNPALELRYMKLNQYWVSGGLPIIVDDTLIGAIGVGGATIDEECAYEGLKTVLGPQPPLAPMLPPPGAAPSAAQR